MEEDSVVVGIRGNVYNWISYEIITLSRHQFNNPPTTSGPADTPGFSLTFWEKRNPALTYGPDNESGGDKNSEKISLKCPHWK